MTDARINARLDAAAARKLEVLKRRTGLTTSEIVRVALDQLYAAKKAPPAAGAEAILRSSGFIGCARADADLSTNYKRSQAKSLRGKIT